MKKVLLILGMISTISSFANAEENKLGIGLGIGVSNRVFKTKDNAKVVPIPMLDIQYDNAFIKGLRVGYNVYNQDRLALSLFVDPMMGFHIKGKDMESGYKNIDTRNFQVMGGASLSYETGWEDIVTNLSYSWGENGARGEISAFKPITVTDRFFLVPGINLNYFSDSFNNYYFGVSPQEAFSNSKLKGKSYKADDGFSVGASLNGEYLWNDNMSLMLFTGLQKFSNDISDSPLVENDLLFIMGAGFKYNF
jgi:outer membrane protein